MSSLKAAFHALLQRHTVADKQVDALWQEIVEVHSTPDRRYHGLRHLEDLYRQLLMGHVSVEDPDAVLLAILYHDFVYATDRNDNEERSAEVLRDRMGARLRLPEPLVQRAAVHILATQKHAPGDDPDTALFTDADLSILGADPARYAAYAAAIRAEFSRYPDEVYKPGRAKVLQHFLGMARIYKTEHFHARYEEQARSNLRSELEGR